MRAVLRDRPAELAEGRRMITTTELFLALCCECGCGRWMQTARLAELWLRFHPCGDWL